MYVGISLRLGFAELAPDHVICVVLQVFQRQVFQFALQLIQTQLVGQRGIQIGRLLCHLGAGGLVAALGNLAHHVHLTGYHQQHHAHVFGKGEQQVSEVLALHHRLLGIQVVGALQSVDNPRHAFAIHGCNLLHADASHLCHGVEHQGQHRLALQSHLAHCNHGCLQGQYEGVLLKHVAAQQTERACH